MATTNSVSISSELVVLRDHNEPCEHPSEDVANGYAHLGAWFDDEGGWMCDTLGCPGGKKITAERRCSRCWNLMSDHPLDFYAGGLIGKIHGEQARHCEGTPVWVEVT